MHEKSVSELDFDALTKDRKFHPSPEAWDDETLYFLLIDRFSDGHEDGYRDIHNKKVSGGKTPLFDPAKDTNNAVSSEAKARRWREAGVKFAGGNIEGLTSKLGYLKRLGVTAIWVSPVWKQCIWDENSYHGYGTQNFLEIDPRFGTREELKAMVDQAHDLGIYVILDVVVNHAGNVFAYDPDGKTIFKAEGDYPVMAWRDKTGKPTIPFGPVDLKKHPEAWPEGAVWPSELQTSGTFSRKGEIRDWDAEPETIDGDFFSLKDIKLGSQTGDGFEPSEAVKTITRCFQYWVAYADLDGLRLDTLKHMGKGGAKYFCDQIRAYAETLDKTNFYIYAEITGETAADADDKLKNYGVDGALWLGITPMSVRNLVMGRSEAAAFFDLHLGSTEEQNRGGDMGWFRSHYVNFFDDHDLVGSEVKARFASEFGDDRAKAERAVLTATGLIATTLGIPCIYYGTEQSFNGHAMTPEGGDTYVRETMFGGEFGSWGSRQHHFFNENATLYREIAKILKVRRDEEALRRGSIFLREISTDGETFLYPGKKEAANGETYQGIIAWSRIRGRAEIVCALNTNLEKPASAWVTVDDSRHGPDGDKLQCLYSSDPSQVGTKTSGNPEAKNGSAVCITVPPGGFVIFK